MAINNPSHYQRAIFDKVNSMGSGEALSVHGVAGCGKTTTQVAVAEMLAAKKRRVLMSAFNVTIATELQSRIGHISDYVTATNIHKIGNFALMRATGHNRTKVDARKYQTLAKELVRENMALRYDDEYRTAMALAEFVDFVRLKLAETESDYEQIASHYGFTIGGIEKEFFDMARELVKRGRVMAMRGESKDFTDMLYWPVVERMITGEYDWVLVDESQDLNPAQREVVLACRAEGGNFMSVGDPDQAIYEWAGADGESYEKVIELTNADVLPLSVCYRCPDSHLDFARKIVPTIETAPHAIDGIVDMIPLEKLAERVRRYETVMIIGRRNKPLAAALIDLLSANIPAKMLGNEIGKGLIKTVKDIMHYEPCTMLNFPSVALRYMRFLQSKMPPEAFTARDDIEDKFGTILILFERLTFETLDGFQSTIEGLFTNNEKEPVLLSSGHRSKGMEHPHVFILHNDDLPLRRKGQKIWELKQEYKLMYVMTTRAKVSLTWVGASLPALFNPSMLEYRLPNLGHDWGETFYV